MNEFLSDISLDRHNVGKDCTYKASTGVHVFIYTCTMYIYAIL